MSVPSRIFIQKDSIINIGLRSVENIHYQLTPAELTKQSIERGEGVLNDTGALVLETGESTILSPKDRFIIKDNTTSESVNWNEFNIPIATESFDLLYDKMLSYLSEKELWVRDAYSDPMSKLRIRIINESPWSDLFAYNMFLKPEENEIENFKPDWHIVQMPGCQADPNVDGTRQHNFSIINFNKKIILIGGTSYTGEIKKCIFTILKKTVMLNIWT